MASNTRIPKAELTGVYGAVVKRMSRKMLGEVAEPVEVAWHNKKVLNFSFAVGRKAQKWDECDESSMVRRGSAVRVRQRASVPRIPRLSAPPPGCPCDHGCRAGRSACQLVTRVAAPRL